MIRLLKQLLLVPTIVLVASPLSEAQTWLPTGAPVTNWVSLAASADGNKLVAAAFGGLLVNGHEFSTLPGPIYTSTDSGLAWRQTTAPIGIWEAVASSADGNKLAAVLQYGKIYTSADSGYSWVEATNSPSAFWNSIACSADGTEIIAARPGAGAVFGGIYVSTDSGNTWALTSAPTNQDWYSVAASADGTKLLAVPFDGWVSFSTNAGATWTQANIPNGGWQAASVAANGKTFVAAAYDGPIYLSTNSGSTWIESSAPITGWQAVASSADGSRLVATINRGGIYTSSDSGTTWVANCAPSLIWTSVTSSGDGSQLVAVANGGGIYMPMLGITLSSNKVMLSWPTNSINFSLQQSLNPALANWTDVTNLATVNLSNLQYELTLSPTNRVGFYRLKTP
jgi:photosystem II stability/assembly factor-like uncharacterized protein